MIRRIDNMYLVAGRSARRQERTAVVQVFLCDSHAEARLKSQELKARGLIVRSGSAALLLEQ